MGIPNKRWHQVRLRVTREKIEAWLDGRKVIDLARGNRHFTVQTGYPGTVFGLHSFGQKQLACLRNIRKCRLYGLGAEFVPPKITAGNRYQPVLARLKTNRLPKAPPASFSRFSGTLPPHCV